MCARTHALLMRKRGREAPAVACETRRPRAAR
jgi:hypothetical protein